jgi:hypothetical protein
MTHMTKSISLALISSSLILADCTWKSASAKETDKETDKEERKAENKSTSSQSGTDYQPWNLGWGSSWGSANSSGRAGTSTNRPGGSNSYHSGGFGNTGHAAGT